MKLEKAKTNTVNQKDINRIPTRLKLATGNYMLQTMRTAYNQNPIDPTCKLCNQAEETVSHFLICCKTLEYLRAPTVNNIIEESSKLFASHCILANPTDLRGRLPIFNLFYRLQILNNILPVL